MQLKEYKVKYVWKVWACIILGFAFLADLRPRVCKCTPNIWADCDIQQKACQIQYIYVCIVWSECCFVLVQPLVASGAVYVWYSDQNLKLTIWWGQSKSQPKCQPLAKFLYWIAFIVQFLCSLCASCLVGCSIERCNASMAIAGVGGHKQGKLGSRISLKDLYLVLWFCKGTC